MVNPIRGVTKFMEEKIEVCRKILSSDQNKLTTGCVLIGAGIGMIVSGIIQEKRYGVR